MYMVDEVTERIYQEAWRSWQDGHHADAIRLLDNAIASSDDYRIKSICLYIKGHFAYTLGDYALAATASREAVDLMPRNVGAYRVLGMSQLRLGRYSAAAEAFEVVVITDPDCSALTLLAKARIELGDAAGARQAAERALALEPEWKEARELLKEINDSAERN